MLDHDVNNFVTQVSQFCSQYKDATTTTTRQVTGPSHRHRPTPTPRSPSEIPLLLPPPPDRLPPHSGPFRMSIHGLILEVRGALPASLLPDPSPSSLLVADLSSCNPACSHRVPEAAGHGVLHPPGPLRRRRVRHDQAPHPHLHRFVTPLFLPRPPRPGLRCTKRALLQLFSFFVMWTSYRRQTISHTHHQPQFTPCTGNSPAYDVD